MNALKFSFHFHIGVIAEREMMRPFGIRSRESSRQSKSFIQMNGHRAQRSVIERLSIARSQGWKCAGCFDLLNAAFEIDHKVPFSLVGENTPLQALCSNCHSLKSRFEQRLIARVKRQRRVVEQSRFRKWWSVCPKCAAIYDSMWFPAHHCRQTRPRWTDLLDHTQRDETDSRESLPLIPSPPI